MTYAKVGWQNGTGPYLYPGLVQMDDGIFGVDARTTSLETAMDTDVVRHVTNIAALRALSGSDLTGVLEVDGYLVAGDNGGGTFWWDSTAAPSFTVNTSTDTFTATNHGFYTGQKVKLYGSSLPTGTNSSTVYYLVRLSASTFKLSTTIAGATGNLVGSPANIVDVTSTGSGSMAVNLADDNGMVIVPTANPQDGRWKRKYDGSNVDAAWFGARDDYPAGGAMENSVPVQAAIDFIRTRYAGNATGRETSFGQVRMTGKGTYYFGAGIVLYVDQVKLVGDGGAYLYFTGLGSGASGIRCTTQVLNASYNRIHGLEGLYVAGDNAAGVTGLDLHSLSASVGSGMFQVTDCALVDFAVNCHIGTGSAIVGFDGVWFSGPGTYVKTSGSLTGSGERFTFQNCSFIDFNVSSTSTAFDFQVGGDGVQVHLNQCSIDYTSIMGYVTNNARMTLVNCWLEASQDAYYWFDAASGANTKIQLIGCTLVLTGTRTTYNLFNCASAVTTGGVEILDCHMYQPSTYNPTYLINGSGRAVVRNLTAAKANAWKNYASQSVTAATQTITASGPMKLLTSNGNYTMTSAPTIPTGQNEEVIKLINVGTNTITLQDQGTLASSNLRLVTSTIALGPRDSVELTYSADLGDWMQTGPLVNVI